MERKDFIRRKWTKENQLQWELDVGTTVNAFLCYYATEMIVSKLKYLFRVQSLKNVIIS